jgi:hypothetical protein
MEGKSSTHEMDKREPRVEGDDIVDGLEVFLGECEVQCLQIAGQVLDFPPTDDREDESCFVHDVCNCNWTNDEFPTANLLSGRETNQS